MRTLRVTKGAESYWIDLIKGIFFLFPLFLLLWCWPYCKMDSPGSRMAACCTCSYRLLCSHPPVQRQRGGNDFVSAFLTKFWDSLCLGPAYASVHPQPVTPARGTGCTYDLDQSVIWVGSLPRTSWFSKWKLRLLERGDGRLAAGGVGNSISVWYKVSMF